MIDSPKISVRVRIAPSPTGFLHVGTARTALFNWLFAKQHNGKFILRVEDTDIERSEKNFENDIISGLKWLGIEWDEGPDVGGDYGPYRQSERPEIYEKYLEKLLAENKAYYCFCSKEDLEEDRKAMLAQGLAPKYSGRCRNLTPEKINELSETKTSIIRFKTPETVVEFNDLIRGKIKFDSSLIGDIVIAKNLKSPLFNFAVVVDDFEMKINYVIRGEDHLSNTPKQILLQKAMGFDEVKYAHLPLILAPDRSKLSKRFLETSLNDYKDQGYLPEAIVNFLILLGWHPKGDKEILEIKEITEEFNLKNIQKAGAIFNAEKLDWLNSQYIKKIPTEKLAEYLKNFVPAEWLENKELFLRALKTQKERMKKLADFRELANFFFELPDYDKKLLFWGPETENGNKAADNLKILNEEIGKIFKVDFNSENLEKLIMPLTEVYGRGELLWPLRAALSGQKASPGPFEIMEVLGKEETIKRINAAIAKLKQ